MDGLKLLFLLFLFLSPTFATTLSYKPPTPADNSAQKLSYIIVTYTITYTCLEPGCVVDNCPVQIDATNYSATITGSSSPQTCTYNLTSVADANHTFRAYAWIFDAGREPTDYVTAAANRTVRIDNIAPTVTAANVWPNVAYYNSTISCGGKITDTLATTGSAYGNLYRNGTVNKTLAKYTFSNNTAFNYTTTATNFVKGATLICEVFGDDALQNSTKVNSSTLTISNSNPNINLNQPIDNYHNNVNLTANFTVSDIDLGDTLNCDLWSNGTLRTSNTSSRAAYTYLTSNYSVDGNFTWLISCTDGTQQVNSSLRYYIFDTINPAITWFNPAITNTTRSPYNLTLNAQANDTNGIYNATYRVFNTTGDICYNSDVQTTGANYTWNQTCNFSVSSLNTVELSACDPHTNKTDDLTEVNYFARTAGLNQNLIWRNSKGDQIWEVGLLGISSFGIETIDSVYSLSSWEMWDGTKHKFGFSFEPSGGYAIAVIKFSVRSDYPIYIMQNNQFAGHIVAGKYYMDFDDLKKLGIIGVKQISKKEVLVSLQIKRLLGGIKINLDPATGGLNCWTEQATYLYDPNAPTVAPTSPANGATVNATTATLEATYSDDYNASGICYFRIDDALISGEASGGVCSATTAILAEGLHYWNVTGDDGTQNGTTSATWSFATSYLLGLNVTYEPEVYVGDLTTHALNISTVSGLTDVNATLWWNDTEYGATASSGTGWWYFTTDLLVPNVTANGTNVSFYWQYNLTLVGLTQYNTSSYNQTILTIPAISSVHNINPALLMLIIATFFCWLAFEVGKFRKSEFVLDTFDSLLLSIQPMFFVLGILSAGAAVLVSAILAEPEEAATAALLNQVFIACIFIIMLVVLLLLVTIWSYYVDHTNKVKKEFSRGNN